MRPIVQEPQQSCKQPKSKEYLRYLPYLEIDGNLEGIWHASAGFWLFQGQTLGIVGPCCRGPAPISGAAQQEHGAAIEDWKAQGTSLRQGQRSKRGASSTYLDPDSPTVSTGSSQTQAGTA